MNNLFRITKDNISNIFVEFNKSKSIENYNNKNKINKIDKIKQLNSNNDKKIIEYGKTTIKAERLKKSMKHNLYKISSIDNIIKCFIDFNPKLKLNAINDKFNNKKIYWNDKGHIITEKDELYVCINNKSNKINKYKLIDFGYIKFYGIEFTDEFINKHKIPSLNSIFTFSDNINHFFKLIKLFEYTDKYKIKINQYGKYNFNEIIIKYLPSIILNINKKINLFDSFDNKFTFYIKITDDKTTAFVIDKKEKIICYLNSVEKKTSGYIFFYIIDINTKYKIVDFNKIIEPDKINNLDKKSNLSNISDFTDSKEFF